MRYASSAFVRCTALRSSHGKTATVRMPSSYAARNARTAISPRLATRIVENKGAPGGDGDRRDGATLRHRGGAWCPGPARHFYVTVSSALRAAPGRGAQDRRSKALPCELA